MCVREWALSWIQVYWGGKLSRVLLDSSSSLLFSLLLAQLPVFSSASPVQQRKLQPQDLDRLSNQTKNLLKLTQDLLREHAFDADLEPHRFRTLPAMSQRAASDLQNLELKPTLSKLHADLKLFEHHFEWLNRVSKKHQHPSLPKLAEIIREMKNLMNLLNRQIVTAGASRLPHVAPSLPTSLPYQFDVLQSSHELLQQFKLFCDWAYRAFISLKPKASAAP
ncbi:interleukin-11 isoform X1 [Gadus morhua]|uniref:interleukin-11 isoform X1 n=1 Tax=Gadus morhua TaxID=8049 RepID=UPI0011B4509E|nr:interleukin-11 isoform X1 [Gadus morhua]